MHIKLCTLFSGRRIGFSLFVRHPPIGNSFLLFFATGFLPFRLYGQMYLNIQGALKYSRPLMAYPRVTWIDVILARFILAMMTQVLVIFISFTGIMIMSDTNAIIDPVPILVGLIILALLGLGVGLINAIVGGIWPVWLSLWKIMSRPLFFVSGILFLYEDMSDQVQAIIWWNPILHAISYLRTGFYPTYRAEFVSLLYCFAVALVIIPFGLLIMRRWYKIVFES